MLRNIIQSVPTEVKQELMADDLLDTLLEEMRLLRDNLSTFKSGTVAEFYLPDYSDIFKSFKRGNPRIMHTNNQKFEAMLYQKVFTRLNSRKEKKMLDIEYKECKWQLDKDPRSVTLFTSFPSDLLSQYQFARCNLLESHTGKIKERKHWSSKLSNSSKNVDMSKIPFNKFTLTVFGDGNIFLVSHRKVKQMVVDMSIRDRWNYLTTEARIKGSINKVKHIQDREILLEYF